MIKNAREYQITRAQAARFDQDLARSSSMAADAAMDELQRDALRSQLADLRAELQEYDALGSGELKLLEVDRLEELPRALIRARIAGHLSQRDLAARLGLKEQQIQRYEATDYGSASLTRILEVVRALGLRLRQDVALPSLDVSREAVVERLRSFGFDKKFAQDRFALDDQDETGWRSANAAARVLGLHPTRLFSETPRLSSASAGASFKLPARASETRTIVYAAYARYLAERTIAATPDLHSQALPEEPGELFTALNASYGGVSFTAALQYVWDRGVAVLPLQEAGGFHGAFWKISGRGVIVLKQNVNSEARWLIDLLHELYHAVQAQNVDDSEVIEQSESPFDRRESEEETTATAWANAAALGEREQELAQACADAAGGEIPRMKEAVRRVARREGVAVGLLANYVAQSLSEQDLGNWWGVAINLQESSVSPWETARDVFLERVELHRLDALDRELFARAFAKEDY